MDNETTHNNVSKIIYGNVDDFVFTQAVEYLKEKIVVMPDTYKQLQEEYKSLAFSVAGYTELNILQEFLIKLTKAVEGGQTRQTFAKDMNTFLEERGFVGINPSRAKTIFETNVQTAFNVGHFESMSTDIVKKMRPYWRYETAGDGHVRDEHAVMHGKVYSASDPIWDIWYPPNGFNCRCSVVSLSKRQVKEQGLKVEDEPEYTLNLETGELSPSFPDKGFSNNPAKEKWQPDLSSFPDYLQEAYKARVN